MSDLSTREQIRADAIARVAESLAKGEGRADLIASRHWCMAEAAVDALGDLLPTGIEWGACNTGGGRMVRGSLEEAEADRDRMIRKAETEIAWDAPHEKFDRIERRYTTDWKEAIE